MRGARLLAESPLMMLGWIGENHRDRGAKPFQKGGEDPAVSRWLRKVVVVGLVYQEEEWVWAGSLAVRGQEDPPLPSGRKTVTYM